MLVISSDKLVSEIPTNQLYTLYKNLSRKQVQEYGTNPAIYIPEYIQAIIHVYEELENRYKQENNWDNWLEIKLDYYNLSYYIGQDGATDNRFKLHYYNLYYNYTFGLQQDYEKSFVILDKYEQTDTANRAKTRILHYRSNTYAAKGDLERALEVGEVLIKSESKDTMFLIQQYLLNSKIYRQQGAYKRSYATLQIAQSLFGELEAKGNILPLIQYQFHLEWADYFMSQGLTDSVQVHLNKVYGYHPSLYYTSGIRYETLLGETSDYLLGYEMSIANRQLYTADAEPHYEIGNYYQSIGDDEQALQYYDKALTLYGVGGNIEGGQSYNDAMCLEVLAQKLNLLVEMNAATLTIEQEENAYQTASGQYFRQVKTSYDDQRRKIGSTRKSTTNLSNCTRLSLGTLSKYSR
jgi:tetratricopeptide (TPR) repeat protein